MAEPETPQKKMYRSTKNKIIFGVCGGLGDYFNADPLIFRILFIVLALMQGLGILLYLILALIMPKDKKDGGDFLNEITDNARNLADEIMDHNTWFKSPRNILGLLIIIFGLMLFIQSLFPGTFAGIFVSLVVPVVIIIVGVAFIIKRK